MSAKITRRNFVKGIGVAAMTSMSGAALGACAPKQRSDSSSDSSSSSDGGESKHTWEVPPDPIADSDISDTFEADVIVVGAGIAGNVAALTAKQAGASVICLQKHSGVLTHGTAIASYNSKMAQDAGVVIDTNDLFDTWRVWSENEIDRKMFNLWRDYSGEAVDWLVDLLSDSDLMLVNDPPVDPNTIKAMPFVEKSYPETFMILNGGVPAAMDVVQQKAADAGVDYRFSTPAVQLIRGDGDKSGRVTGVIAQNGDGKYQKFNASKAVILCAGDYANNQEMRDYWAPHLSDLESPYMPPVNTGDGDLMGMWVGAAMDPGPHASNIHYDLSPDSTSEAFCGSGGAPWLRVNTLGQRFSNEDTAYHQIYAQDVLQPGHMHYDIFDADHPSEWPQFTGGFFRGNGVGGPGPNESRDVWAKVLQDAGQDPNQYDNVYDLVIEGGVVSGAIYKADTLEELAGKMNVDASTFKATVDRYNELVDKGEDDDFGKNAKFLFPIKKAPFYAVIRKAHPLGILNGLVVNTSMQVLDDSGNVIEGLYAAGNNSGGKFFGGLVQPMCVPAMTTGRALLTGRVAAFSALGVNR